MRISLHLAWSRAMLNICYSSTFQWLQIPLAPWVLSPLLALGLPLVLRQSGSYNAFCCQPLKAYWYGGKVWGREVFYHLLCKSQSFGGTVSWKCGLHKCFCLSSLSIWPSSLTFHSSCLVNYDFWVCCGWDRKARCWSRVEMPASRLDKLS